MKKIGRRCNKLYRRLGITRGASKQATKAAYYDMATETHPDHGGNADDFIKVKEAYGVLSDTHRKRHYDQTGEWVACGVSRQTEREQKANGLLAIEFAAILTEEKSEIVYVDVIHKIKSRMSAHLKNTEETLMKAQNAIKVAGEILELVEYGGKSVNILEGVLINMLSESEIAKSKLTEDKEVFKILLDIIDKYKFNFKNKPLSAYRNDLMTGTWSTRTYT